VSSCVEKEEQAGWLTIHLYSYIQKGVEILVQEFQVGESNAWVSVLVAVLFAVVVYLLERASQSSVIPFSLRRVRTHCCQWIYLCTYRLRVDS